MSGAGELPLTFRARLLDGRSAVPREGSVEIDGAELRLGFEGHASAVALRDLRSVQRVAGLLQLTLPAGEERGGVEPVVHVDDPRFEEAFEEARRRYGASLAVDVQRLGRFGGWKTWLLIAALVVPAAYVAYAALFPRLVVFVPVEQEVALGEAVYGAVRKVYPPFEHGAFDELVAGMVAELQAADSDYTLRVELVDSSELNAVALPGGRILVFRGLVEAAPSADALAGVLAHEIVHVERRHSVRSLLKTFGTIQFATSAVGGSLEGLEFAEALVEAGSGLLVLRHSREHEAEADAMAIAKLIAAGRSPGGLAEFFELLPDRHGPGAAVPEWMSTHPGTGGRMERARAAAQEAEAGEPWTSVEAWRALQDSVGR